MNLSFCSKSLEFNVKIMDEQLDDWDEDVDEMEGGSLLHVI
jgi:hypothetical protein